VKRTSERGFIMMWLLLHVAVTFQSSSSSSSSSTPEPSSSWWDDCPFPKTDKNSPCSNKGCHQIADVYQAPPVNLSMASSMCCDSINKYCTDIFPAAPGCSLPALDTICGSTRSSTSSSTSPEPDGDVMNVFEECPFPEADADESPCTNTGCLMVAEDLEAEEPIRSLALNKCCQSVSQFCESYPTAYGCALPEVTELCESDGPHSGSKHDDDKEGDDNLDWWKSDDIFDGGCQFVQQPNPCHTKACANVSDRWEAGDQAPPESDLKACCSFVIDYCDREFDQACNSKGNDKWIQFCLGTSTEEQGDAISQGGSSDSATTSDDKTTVIAATGAIVACVIVLMVVLVAMRVRKSSDHGIAAAPKVDPPFEAFEVRNQMHCPIYATYNTPVAETKDENYAEIRLGITNQSYQGADGSAVSVAVV